MQFDNFFQNAYVTRDLDRAMELMKTRFNIKEFMVIEPDIEMITPNGPKRSITRAALGWADNSFLIELIQPMPGSEIDIYSAFLPEDDRPKFHHVAARTFDWEETHRQITAEGWTIAQEHHMKEGLNFMYVDALDTLGHYVEFIWATPEMWSYMGGVES